MEARIITDRRQWNDFVEASSGCNITQSYEWGELAAHRGLEPMYMGVVDHKRRLCATMLLLTIRASKLHKSFFYAPRGPITSEPNSPAMSALLDFVEAEAQKQDAFMLKIEPNVPDADLQWLIALRQRAFHPNPDAIHVRDEWILDIRPEEKDILAGMKEKWRYNVRLAERKGIIVRGGQSRADLDTFYKIYQATSEREQFLIFDKTYYEKLMSLYHEGNRAKLFLAEFEKKTIAGILILRLGHWCWYMYGASSDQHRNLMPNHLLQWTGIQWAKSHNCWYYNFRGIPSILEEGQELWGVYVFKRGFGGYAVRSLETHELVYQPALYREYMKLQEAKKKVEQTENQ